MEPIGDDIGRQFQLFYQKAKAVLSKLPLLAANRGKNFFQDRFRDQAWYDDKYMPWVKRKPTTAKRDNGRAILTDRGHLKRGVRIKSAEWGNVTVGNDVKYAAPNNYGFKGTVRVPEHVRVASRKVATKELKKKGKQRRARLGGKKQKIRGATHVVKAHNRKMNIPKRQFIGNSALLNRLIQRDFANQLKGI